MIQILQAGHQVGDVGSSGHASKRRRIGDYCCSPANGATGAQKVAAFSFTDEVATLGRVAPGGGKVDNDRGNVSVNGLGEAIPARDPNELPEPDAGGDLASDAEMVIMGTGTSIGVPVVGCRCEVCLSNNPRNRRTRTGVLIRAPHGEFIIDAGPELRLQLIRERATLIRAAVMTHSHADHIMGLDDLRIFGFQMNAAVPVYCEEAVETQIRQTFAYAFTEPSTHAHQFAAPKIRFERITEAHLFPVLGLDVQSIRLKHGDLAILGFRIGNVAFCTDVSTIPSSSRDQLKGLDVLVLDALRREPHPTHLHLDAAIRLIRQLKPRKTYLTHMSHELDYDQLMSELPEDIEPAYDGLRIPIRVRS